MKSFTLLLPFICAIFLVESINAHGTHEAKKRGKVPKSLNDEAFIEDEEHIKEHLKEEVEIDETENMTQEQKEFHFFRLHDLDNNTKLDGIEMFMSAVHMVSTEDLNLNLPKDATKQEITNAKEKEICALIDSFMDTDDLNNDGFISYPEFKLRNQKDRRPAKAEPDL